MIPLTLVPDESESRAARDRLELLTALISAPGFDPLYRDDVIVIPRDHLVYGWGCAVANCERPAAATVRGYVNATIRSGCRLRLRVSRWVCSLPPRSR
ncbi:integrase family domain protein [Mycobacterium kansasii]|nr:integrase family domain protein [Mycobacterium kansasii]